MAVLVEGISVIIRASAIHNKVQGGWEEFKQIVYNQTLCADNEVVRVGFMDEGDVKSFVSKLEQLGLEFLRDGEAVDIVVADQMRGFTTKCNWAEYGRTHLNNNKDHEVAACRLIGSQVAQVVTPPYWKYEGSLSHTYGFAPSGQKQKGLVFLRHENGLDVYYDSLSKKEVYVGRTGE